MASQKVSVGRGMQPVGFLNHPEQFATNRGAHSLGGQPEQRVSLGVGRIQDERLQEPNRHDERISRVARLKQLDELQDRLR
jgi:hypothetical protein